MEQGVFDAAVAQAMNAGRPDLYRNIHKALRLCMNQTLAQVGCTDPSDHRDVAAALAATREMLDLFALHLEDENRFVHPALSACRPGSADRTASDHAGHEQAIAALRDLTVALEVAHSPERAAAAARLYQRMALFVEENLEHMHFEETHNMGVLWAACTDDEIRAIEHAIVAFIPPDMMMKFLHWMLPALPHPDRVGMLAGMRDGAPPAAFEATVALARTRLDARDWGKLAGALGLSQDAAVAAWAARPRAGHLSPPGPGATAA